MTLTVRPGILDPVDVEEFGGLLVPGSRIDEDQRRLVLDQHAAHPELDAIPLVGRDASFPERLGDHAEHGAAVELLPARLDGVKPEPTDGQRLDEWSEGRGHAST